MTEWQGVGRALHTMFGTVSHVGDALVGATVTKLLMSPDGHSLFFQTGDNDGVRFEAQGDCCSQSYFHEIYGLENLLGQYVVSLEEIDLPDSISTQLDDNYNPQYKECIRYYGLKVTTNKGYTSIIYRNESNGYYGGWCNPGFAAEKPKGYLDIVNDGDLYKENEPEAVS